VPWIPAPDRDPAQAFAYESGIDDERRLAGRIELTISLPRTAFSRPAVHRLRLFGASVIVGVLAGLAAAGLEFALHVGAAQLIDRVAAPGEAHILRLDWRLLLLPAAGCLIAGLWMQILAGRSRLHGTNLLVRAFHREAGDLPLRAPLAGATGAIGVISCGGSAGPEGPIAALGAAIGSNLGRVLDLSAQERRILLIAGCGAGVGAIFQCPLGGALFAAGILYREPEFEGDALAPAIVASVIGYSTFMLFPLPAVGTFMLNGATALAFTSPLDLAAYALLGPVCAFFSMLLYKSMHFVERRPLARMQLPRFAAAGLGGLCTGLLACLLPQVVDGRYQFIQNALDDHLLRNYPGVQWWQWAALFGTVAMGKCLATGFTVGSGAPGGVLGPCVFIGGAAGAFLGAVLEAVLPGGLPDNLRQALIPVAMGGVLSASMRVPLSAIVMATEMTGSYGLIVPLMLVCVSSYLLGRRWGLNDEQVRTASESPVHAGDRIVHLLQAQPVGAIMQADWAETVGPGATLRELVGRINPGTRPVFAVVEGSALKGLISLPDVERAVQEPGLAEVIIAADMMTTELATLHPDDDAYHALADMARENHVVMPVVSREQPPRFLGMLTRTHIYEAVQRGIDQMRQVLLSEHEGLAAIDQEDHLHQLVMGVPAAKKEVVQRLLVPLEALGHSLRESDFRRQFGIQVVALEQPDGTLQCPPDPDTPLLPGHRLVAIVWRE
jgi:CIC family chloride channel protein